MKKITIAIDGYSSTGKSTIAKRLASALGYVFVDTEAMYRAVTSHALISNYVDEHNLNVTAIVDSLSNIHLKFIPDAETGKFFMYLNDENVEQEIRSMSVSRQVSKIATIKEVRIKLVAMQQQMGKEKGAIKNC